MYVSGDRNAGISANKIKPLKFDISMSWTPFHQVCGHGWSQHWAPLQKAYTWQSVGTSCRHPTVSLPEWQKNIIRVQGAVTETTSWCCLQVTTQSLDLAEWQVTTRIRSGCWAVDPPDPCWVTWGLDFIQREAAYVFVDRVKNRDV
jgi:hypothetical protein